jgi:hypothetical protein
MSANERWKRKSRGVRKRKYIPGVAVVHRGEKDAAEADTEEEREKSVSDRRRRKEEERRRTRCTARSASS